MTTAETGHIGLTVTDLDRSKGFYQSVFGFEVGPESSDEDRRWAFLTDAGRIVITLWEQSSKRFDPTYAGLHHLSFKVDSVDDVQAAQDRLRALDAEFVYDGVVPHSEGADSGGIFFLDPDGTRLEIFTESNVAEQASEPTDGPSCGFF